MNDSYINRVNKCLKTRGLWFFGMFRADVPVPGISEVIFATLSL